MPAGSPVADFQSRTVRPVAVRIIVPSGLKAAVPPCGRWIVRPHRSPEAAFQRRAVLSAPAVRMSRPSGLQSAARTWSECPMSAWSG